GLFTIPTVETHPNAVAAGRVRNCKLWRSAQLEFKREFFAAEARRFVREQIRYANYQTGNGANNQKRPTLCNKKSCRALAPNEQRGDNTNDEAHENSKRRAQKNDEHPAPALHVRHVSDPG